MMIYWYNLYTFWTAILCLLAWARLVPFSVIPSVIGTIIGTLGFLYLKLRVGKQMSIEYVTIQIVLHLFPFLILPLKFTHQDVLINIGIFILFNLWLLVQGETFVSMYRAIVYEDGRLTLIDYARRRGFISDQV